MKRNLTVEEITDIINYVFKDENVQIPIDIHQSVIGKHEKELRRQLEKIEIYPEMIDELKKTIHLKYNQSIISPGESIGILCAQSIGEKQTQMTLNTFHAAGITVQTVITGVPRFLELLNASKDPKLSSSHCKMKKRYNNHNELKKELNQEIIDIRIIDLTKRFDIKEKLKDEPYWYRYYTKLYKTPREKYYRECQYFVSYQMDIEKLCRFHIYPCHIIQKLYDEYEDIYCIASPTHLGVIDIYFDMSDVKTPEQYDITCNDISITDDNLHTYYLEEIAISNINQFMISGIPEIKDYFIEKKDDDYYIHTKGNNFQKLLGHPSIEPNFTISNNMWNIYETLGIEATREFLIMEFMNIVSSDGAYINKCHVELLVDIMTFTGTIVSISRYGMKSDQFGPLAKASFEESLDNFLKASFFSEKETTKDVSASVICGKRSNIGTGICDLLLDIQHLL